MIISYNAVVCPHLSLAGGFDGVRAAIIRCNIWAWVGGFFKHLLHDTKWEGECVAQKFPESNLLSICSNQGWLKHLQGGSKIASSGLEVAEDMIFREPKQLSWAAKSISSKS